jgi:hypothetical protein
MIVQTFRLTVFHSCCLGRLVTQIGHVTRVECAHACDTHRLTWMHDPQAGHVASMEYALAL